MSNLAALMVPSRRAAVAAALQMGAQARPRGRLAHPGRKATLSAQEAVPSPPTPAEPPSTDPQQARVRLRSREREHVGQAVDADASSAPRTNVNLHANPNANSNVTANSSVASRPNANAASRDEHPASAAADAAAAAATATATAGVVSSAAGDQGSAVGSGAASNVRPTLRTLDVNAFRLAMIEAVCKLLWDELSSSGTASLWHGALHGASSPVEGRRGREALNGPCRDLRTGFLWASGRGPQAPPWHVQLRLAMARLAFSAHIVCNPGADPQALAAVEPMQPREVRNDANLLTQWMVI
jgi:hypothetical protein